MTKESKKKDKYFKLTKYRSFSTKHIESTLIKYPNHSLTIVRFFEAKPAAAKKTLENIKEIYLSIHTQ